MRIFVTGGAGFIGSAVVRLLLGETDHEVVNLDKLTYAGNLASLADVQVDPRYTLEQVDICDAQRVGELFAHYQPDALLHLAAESHVDRSIDGPAPFIETNIVGVYTLLEASRAYWQASGKDHFRFHHVSTDEVFGSLGPQGEFTEETPYHPSSPYSASKAAADHLVRAWHATFGLPVLLTNCSNNYGPRQYPEKLIPLMILSALAGRPLPVYGHGQNVRDWLYVDDHARALLLVLERGTVGQSYNIGGGQQRTNLQVVQAICALMDEFFPHVPWAPHASLVTHVADRPGHDFRYAIDASKLERELGWRPRESFDSGLRRTVEWYLSHESWWRDLQEKHPSTRRQGLAVSARAR